MLRLIVGVCTFGVVCTATFGQGVGERTVAFEVASVKPQNPDVVDEVELRASGRRLTATNLSLQMLVAAAYGVEVQQVTGGPDWIQSERFNIAANAPEDFSDHGDRVSALGQQLPRTMMLMLQTLLADRLHVRVHKEMKESTTYDLVTAKGGPKLHATKNLDKAPYLGLRQGPHDPGAILLDARRASMQLLAERLKRLLRAPVTDRTGIAGEFDFQVESSGVIPLDAVPTIFSAIQEELGLKLEAKKGSAEAVVVDHAEKPSEN